MILLQELKRAISDSQLISYPLIERDRYLLWLKEASKNKLIKAVVGFRRAGKSQLLKLLCKSLINDGVPESNIFFLNFENDLLTEIRDVKDLRQIWDRYVREIADINKPIYIIWDEIQLVDKWEKLVRTLYEMGKYNIFISGSNNKLLSGELSSSLSGRALTLEVSPFSFSEYLDFHNINHNHYYSNKDQIDKSFVSYLNRGGLAEQFNMSDNMAVNYKEGIIQKIIIDDIVKRYQIDKINVLKEIFDFVSGNITSTTSLRKIAERIKNQGIPISILTVNNYLQYWQTAYALSKLSKFDYKLSRVFNKTNKYYVIDNLFVPQDDNQKEKRLENLVYNELVRRYGMDCISFGQNHNGYEVDFIVKDEDKFLFFQVCLQLNDINAKREIGNLELIQKSISGDAKIIALDDVRKKSTDFESTSVIEWLLEK